jgi:hypothetical protein
MCGGVDAKNHHMVVFLKPRVFGLDKVPKPDET